MRSPRLRLAAVFLIVLAAFALLDRAIYSGLIFAPTYHGGWDQFRWYAFERQRRRLASSRPDATKPLVIVAGSSIAKYAVQRDLLTLALQDQGHPARVEMLVHASLMPVDLRHYLQDLDDGRPRVLLYLLNPADLDLERYLPPWEAGPDYADEMLYEYLGFRLPMLLYYPGRFAFSKPGKQLPWGERLRLALRSVSPALRFKNEWWDPLLYNWRSEHGVLKSYLNYQGIPIREGLWREGRSGACFSIPAELVSKHGLQVQMVRVLQETPGFSVQVYAYNEAAAASGSPTKQASVGRHVPQSERRGARERQALQSKPTPCTIPAGSRQLTVLRPKHHGWRHLELPPTKSPRARYFFLLSHVTRWPSGEVLRLPPGAPAHYGQGLRFPGQFGRTSPATGDSQFRRLALEDLALANMTDAQYARDFRTRLHPQDWRAPQHAALHQFNRLRLAKELLNWYDFTPIPLARELERIADALPPGTKLILVNNPENPLTAETYQSSQWYAGYLAYMQKLGQKPGVRFVDLSRALPAQSFSDAHHLTFFGVQQMSPRYATEIGRALDRPQN